MDDLPYGSVLCDIWYTTEKPYLTNTKILHFKDKDNLVFKKQEFPYSLWLLLLLRCIKTFAFVLIL